MKYKLFALALVLALALCMAGCGTGEETTLTGMVVSVDGTLVSLLQFDSEMQGWANGQRPSMSEDGEMPSMREGMEDFTMPEGFDPENFYGRRPEGFDPESFDGTRPSGMGNFREGETRPTMPSGESGGRWQGFAGFGSEGETIGIDLTNAHISVEIDGGKAAGSMEDITVGTFLTVTLNGKGEATNVLVSSISGSGRGFRPTN